MDQQEINATIEAGLPLSLADIHYVAEDWGVWLPPEMLGSGGPASVGATKQALSEALTEFRKILSDDEVDPFTAIELYSLVIYLRSKLR